MCLAEMLTKFHCPSTNTFVLAGFENNRTECILEKPGFGRDKKTGKPRKLKEVFVMHSAPARH
jgi:hypothetical protein